MTPSSDSAGSPLATLRQLKEMLDAGTITPAEFEALKQQLVFGAKGDAPPTATPGPVAADVPPAPVPTPYLDTPAALTPEATPLLTPEPDWLAAPAALPASVLADDQPEFNDEPELAAERRNPLNLVFAIGGLLLFLGVVAYLTLGRPTTPDEHVTSTSQTAADTTSASPEIGPQAEQLTLPPAAAPETVRVAPAVAPVAAPLATDTAATPSASTPAAPTSAAPVATPKVTAPKPAITTPKSATPASVDTATTTP
jgi:hypothetical protein